jgi:hypothetical protein
MVGSHRRQFLKFHLAVGTVQNLYRWSPADQFILPKHETMLSFGVNFQTNSNLDVLVFTVCAANRPENEEFSRGGFGTGKGVRLFAVSCDFCRFLLRGRLKQLIICRFANE